MSYGVWTDAERLVNFANLNLLESAMGALASFESGQRCDLKRISA